MRASSMTAWAAVVGVSVLGCGGGENGTGLDGFLTEITTAACQRQVACGQFPDQATCEASTSLGMEPRSRTLKAAIERGTVVYHPERWHACRDGLRTDCSAGDDQPDDCYLMFQGTLAEGATCVANDECADRGFCTGVDACGDACCVGTCSAPGRYLAARDQPCLIASVPACARGSYCQDGRCVARLPAGSACAGDDPCEPPAFCETVAGTGGGATCVVGAATGAACDPLWLHPCSSVADLCNLETLKCEKRRQPGQPCASSKDCVDSATCQDGACRSGLVGAACDPQAPLPCYRTLVCAANVCTVPPEATACTPPARP